MACSAKLLPIRPRPMMPNFMAEPCFRRPVSCQTRILGVLPLFSAEAKPAIAVAGQLDATRVIDYRVPPISQQLKEALPVAQLDIHFLFRFREIVNSDDRTIFPLTAMRKHAGVPGLQ